jgi:hypothetical protein
VPRHSTRPGDRRDGRGETARCSVETGGSPFHPACISVTDMRVEDVRTPRVSDVSKMVRSFTMVNPKIPLGTELSRFTSL